MVKACNVIKAQGSWSRSPENCQLYYGAALTWTEAIVAFGTSSSFGIIEMSLPPLNLMRGFWTLYRRGVNLSGSGLGISSTGAKQTTINNYYWPKKNLNAKLGSQIHLPYIEFSTQSQGNDCSQISCKQTPLRLSIAVCLQEVSTYRRMKNT